MTTIAAGAEGNSAPIVATIETWHAKGLSNLMVRMVSDDPRSGHYVQELTELDRSEPDASLFEPPASYHVTNVEWHVAPCSQ